MRRQHEELIGIDHGAPEIAATVERDAVRPGTLAEVAGAKDFAVNEVSISPIHGSPSPLKRCRKTRLSSLPFFSTISASADLIPGLSVTSTAQKETLLRSRSPGEGGRFPTTETVWPCSENIRTSSRPTPRVPPIIRLCLLIESSPVSSGLLKCCHGGGQALHVGAGRLAILLGRRPAGKNRVSLAERPVGRFVDDERPGADQESVENWG